MDDMDGPSGRHDDAPSDATSAGVASRLVIEPMAWFPSLNGNLRLDPGGEFDIDAIGISAVRVVLFGSSGFFTVPCRQFVSH